MDVLARRFEEHRTHLRAVAHRMLGSLAEADDAVQETWLKLARAGADDIDNLGGWLTTVVGRVCLDALRARRLRREDPLEAHLPDPVIGPEDTGHPEAGALTADSVGPALLVVLESLTPAERLAFVLHDLFGLPFEDIAPIVDRTPVAARKLASRARGRVRGATPSREPDPATQRRVVDAFLAAAREGDFEALVAILDPDVVLRADNGTLTVVRGAEAVAGRAAVFRRAAGAATTRPALVNGAPGLVNTLGGGLLSVMGFTVAGGRVVAIDILSDPARLARLDLGGLGVDLRACRVDRPEKR
ncbi:sigma-70 family RNA polymerase sigma factor [Saccharothrix syringae]|uniref:Sigma-70 family RNA polymerase sigma factor n=1 Tax=Saccharothrix syringae TaxID=103733 RepID=A0A5Q0H149_SACSY|nr:sigma-70 family RNA polymerase sigma factor [Saccharothrix syringae]QFZ19928.1 sigma-70 family RNA polymerase sigma factor [Saccharothrix syringae]